MPIFTGTGQRVGAFVGAGAVAVAVVLGVTTIDTGGPGGGGGGSTTTTTTTTASAAPYVCLPTPNVPGGDDGNGGCWPGPGNTGPATAPTTVYVADMGGNNRHVFSTDVTLDHLIINEPILVYNGGHLTIKNSIVNQPIEVYQTGALDVIDSDVHGQANALSTISGYNFDLTRVDIDGGNQPAICYGGCNWVDVYSHDPHYFPDVDAHQSAFATVGVDGDPITVTHSTLWCNVPVAPTGGGCTANVALQPNFAPVQNVTISHNLLPSGADIPYCLTGGYAPASANYSEFAPLSNHVVITDNVFGKRSANNKCGAYGTTTNFNTSAVGNVFTGNVYADGTPVTPNN